MALSEKVGSCSQVHLYQSFTLSTLSRIYDLRSNALYPTNNNNASGLGDISEKKSLVYTWLVVVGIVGLSDSKTN